MYDIYHDLTINCSLSELLTTCSTPKGFALWWTKFSEGKPEPGTLFRFYFDDDYDWYAKVIDKTDKRIGFEFTKADEDWTGTRLFFKIESLEHGLQKLSFEHTGWPQLNDHYRRSNYCWAMYLRLLKRYLESGEITEYEKRNET
ncbi:MAG: hypothetical protein KJO29_12460 [Bacteroidia bacterium]|nr:hypothetical protein [Bacteroidia bacterium]